MQIYGTQSRNMLIGSRISADLFLNNTSGFIWIILINIFIFIIFIATVSPLYIVWASFARPALAAGVLAAIAFIYSRNNRDPQLAAVANASSQLIALATICAPLSYAAAAAGAMFPLQDNLLLGIDKSLGFDWLYYANLIDKSALASHFLTIIYQSLPVQLFVIFFILSFSHQSRLKAAMLSLVLCTLTIILVSVLVPSVGYIHISGLNQNDFANLNVYIGISQTDIILLLRNGSLAALTAEGSIGIINFPSLHTALAIFFIIWIWPVPLVRVIVLFINVTMLISIPFVGCHYLTDMIGGATLAAMMWLIARQISALLESSDRRDRRFDRR